MVKCIDFLVAQINGLLEQELEFDDGRSKKGTDESREVFKYTNGLGGDGYVKFDYVRRAQPFGAGHSIPIEQCKMTLGDINLTEPRFDAYFAENADSIESIHVSSENQGIIARAGLGLPRWKEAIVGYLHGSVGSYFSSSSANPAAVQVKFTDNANLDFMLENKGNNGIIAFNNIARNEFSLRQYAFIKYLMTSAAR